MNTGIMIAVGMLDKVELVAQKKCPFCQKEVHLNSFRNELSRKEYGISGICQKCQDDFFGAD